MIIHSGINLQKTVFRSDIARRHDQKDRGGIFFKNYIGVIMESECSVGRKKHDVPDNKIFSAAATTSLASMVWDGIPNAQRDASLISRWKHIGFSL